LDVKIFTDSTKDLDNKKLLLPLSSCDIFRYSESVDQAFTMEVPVNEADYNPLDGT
jgi:hypothetical protein